MKSKQKQPTGSKTTRQRLARQTQFDSPAPSVSATLHQQITGRAYEHYERRIRQGPLDDWLQAEQEILGQENTRNAGRAHRGGYAGEEQD
jgi:DUF2934 family protein